MVGGVIRAGVGKFEGDREEVRAYRGGGGMQGSLLWNARMQYTSPSAQVKHQRMKRA